MTKKDEALKKRDAIMTATQIINMPKYKVLGHETTKSFPYDPNMNVPKGAKTMLVIYLK